MLWRRVITRALALAALLVPVAAAVPAALATSSPSAAKVNGICRTDYSATKKWSRTIPMIESDEDMALWEKGIAQHFGWTARDLRGVGARTLATHFDRVAAGHRAAAVAYFSGSYASTKKAEVSLRAVSTRAMKVATSQGATVCAAFVADFRP